MMLSKNALPCIGLAILLTATGCPWPTAPAEVVEPVMLRTYSVPHGYERNVVYRWVWRAEEAQDIVQEAFVRLWRMRERVDLATVEPLVHRIALNLGAQRVVVVDGGRDVHGDAVGRVDVAAVQDVLHGVGLDLGVADPVPPGPPGLQSAGETNPRPTHSVASCIFTDNSKSGQRPIRSRSV